LQAAGDIAQTTYYKFELEKVNGAIQQTLIMTGIMLFLSFKMEIHLPMVCLSRGSVQPSSPPPSLVRVPLRCTDDANRTVTAAASDRRSLQEARAGQHAGRAV
jgi:hypothetical protein